MLVRRASSTKFMTPSFNSLTVVDFGGVLTENFLGEGLLGDGGVDMMMKNDGLCVAFLCLEFL